MCPGANFGTVEGMDTNQNKSSALSTGGGLALGVGVGVALSIALDSWAWMGLGVFIGLLLAGYPLFGRRKDTQGAGDDDTTAPGAHQTPPEGTS